MQFNRKVILAFSVTASVIVYLTRKSSSKQQQQQSNDVLERVFALHAKAMEDSVENDTDVARKSDSDDKDSSSVSRNLFSLIGAVGGELEVDDTEGPWADYNEYMTLYSSTPFNPRHYTGDDTEYLHLKEAMEQDEDGTTTFPPTRKPIQQNIGGNSGKPTAHPTRLPTRLPVTLEPTELGETRHPTREPTREPTKFPTREPTKFPTREPTNDPSRRPTPNPSRFPTKLPTREPTRDPTREPTRDPSPGPIKNPTREPSGGPTRLPTRLPSNIPTREPTKEPTKDPSRNPTSPPIQQQTAVATPNPTKRPTSGIFYCGASVEDASSCKYPCPGGITDCATGFCYAVSQCIEQVDAAVTPDPTQNPTPQPTEEPTTNDFFCGETLDGALSACEFACPSGSPSQCPDNLTCYASTGTGCLEEPGPSPARSPGHDPSASFYCGSSFQEASQQCLVPCPTGLSSDCPAGQACYANTPCSDKNGFFCGSSIVNASASCQYPCANGLDSECPSGLSCYETQTCKTWGQTQSPTRAPIEPAVDDGTKYCGYSYEHAATQCTQPCESGLSDQCPEGMSCYSHTPCEEKNTFYCGISWNNAASSCRYPCPSGTNAECPLGTQCYAYTTCDETDSFMCGTSFEDASSNCDEPCPTGSPTECPSGESCFTHTTCNKFDSIEDKPTAAPVEPYIPGDSFFCGTSYLEASSQCTHPCPTRLDSECPDGEQCYGSTPCPNRDTYYCGANLDEASAICDYPCPTGRSEDCPTGLSCFAFTTCADKDTFYCGNNYIEASGTCDTPCPSGLSSDCPEGLTCFAHTTCTIEEKSEEPEPSGPIESYFCGFTFDEATTDCSLPCPSGKSSACPTGMSCFSHTSCADRDSFMCGYTWESASATCSNPCPSGEHSDCPDGMSCFAYTPCNNDGSYFCGNSFDEASDCQHPCPSGEASECPSGLSCFSYTTCGTGDFNTKAPTRAPTPVKYVPTDSFYCGTSFDDASRSCEYKCPNGSTDCPIGLACYEYTTCVGGPSPAGGPSPSLSPTGERDSFYCGMNYADANEKCLVPCPSGNSNECPTGESCIPFTSCNEQDTTTTPDSTISTTFYCGLNKEDAERSCNRPCPGGTEDCLEDGMSCYSFTSCVDLPGNEPTPTVPNTEPSPSSNTEPSPSSNTEPSPSSPGSFYCGSSFENATSSCLVPCPGGTSGECPIGQSCYGYTACDDHDTFYCGTTWDNAASTCSKPCPSGSNAECDNGEICFGYTPCGAPDTDIPVESFYCGATFEEASLTCSQPCPSSKHSECPDGEMCHPYTPCGERDSMYCGTSWTDAATSCLIPCPSGSSSDCPIGQSCFPSTPCDETESFFCGSSFDDATSKCGIPCPTGQSITCPGGQGCFAYTLCNEDGSNAVPTPTLAPIPVAPPDSYFCGTSFDEASSVCNFPCPSGLSEDCPAGLLCFASTPCSDKGSFFCGVTWEEAASTCALPCESGLSSDCPDGQKCFGYTPCSKSDSFYCGTSFDEASSTCTDPCPSGLDEECPGSETCHKYTPCNDIAPPSNEEPNLVDIPVDSFFCGVNFTDASDRCYLPCPSGSAAECPVGEACYGNTPCSGGDSFFCGTTWYDAASECKIPCPSGIDDECPADSKCFGYTPCSDTNSYYCGVDFYDASTNCIKPCPTGSSSECPEGLACFPNTPCDSNDGSTPTPTISLTTSSPVKKPTNFPTKLPTKLPTSVPTASIQQMSATSAPHVSMFLYCGTDIDNVNCLLPCPNGDECPLGHECYATTECSESFYCGQTFADANNTCTQACPDGLDASCPENEFCFAQTSCADPKDDPEKNVVDVGSFYCGKNYTDASKSCSLACPSGSSSECAELGPEYSCYANTPCDDSDTYFCGTTWNHAASNCLFPCKSGLDSECPDNTFCFPYTSCNDNDSFMCGTSFEDSASCLNPCPSGSSSECPFGQSCFTHTTCSTASEPKNEPTASPVEPFIPQDSFYCGISFIDAATQCTQPCPTRSDSECPEGEQCFANTPCPNRDTYYCGRSLEEASSSCEYPCPTGASDECPEELACFAFTTCADKDSYFCGTNFIDASSNCNIPCKSGLSSDCPDDLTCFAFTTCNPEVDGEDPVQDPIDKIASFCGTTFDDASEKCTIPCSVSEDCPDQEACFPYTTCNSPAPEETDIPVDSFFCGTTYEEASMTCTEPCPSGSHKECPDGQWCFPNTPCNQHDTYYCGATWKDAATSCLLPCPSGSNSDCPIGQSCFPSTPCDETDSFFCGSSFEDASTSCSIPCDFGRSDQCPDGQGCFAYTLCNKDGPNAVPSGSLEPVPTSPPDSYFCGDSFDDASSSCTHPCPSGLSNECPNGLLCFASTSCNDKGSFFCGVTWEEAASACTLPCESGLNSDCPIGQKCYGYTPCMREDTFYCGTSFDEASSTCTDPCPSGLDEECPGSEKCYKYTPCADGIPEFSTGPTSAPLDSYYCGKSFDDADRCTTPCPSGSAAECPIGEACFAHTTCSMLHPETFFCGSSFKDASSCAVPCEDGVCQDGRSCYAYTPCAGDIAAFSEPITPVPTRKPTSKPTIEYPTESYYCGVSFEDASTQCAIPCPLKTSSVCPPGETCFANTPCHQNEPKAEVTFSPIPIESYFCGLSYMDASGKCQKPCPSRDSSECPGAENCYAFTPCKKPESFFCGSSLDDANESCTVPCPTGRSDSCPSGESCFAYTTCKGDMSSFSEPAVTPPPTSKFSEPATTPPPTSKPTASPSNFPTKYPTKNPTPFPTNQPSNKPTSQPTPNPTRLPTKNPTNYPTTMPTKYPTKYPTASPTKSPIVPVVFDVPKESFYCGVNFEHATQICGVPCPNGPSDCPPGLNCYGNTPCADRMSFFCGTSYDDANEKCTKPCPSGSAEECDGQQSCFAYTSCRLITAAPTEDPTFKPTLNPTTPRPTSSPTKNPTSKPTSEPTPPPTVKETPRPTVKETPPPTVKETPPPTVKETPPPTVKETPRPTEKETAEEATPDEEEPTEMSEAVVIELKPCEDPLAMTVNQAYWRSWSSDRPETCNKFEASDIDDQTYTHLVYSFASISAAGHVEPWAGSWDEVEKYKEFNKVKERNSAIKTIIAVTEGIFYGGGMNPVSFTEIAETEASRMAFAQSAISFLDMYNFDGIDLDWEAPLDRDRGGSPDNYERFVQLAQEIRSAIDESGKGYLLTIALPGTDWEQLDYDIVALSEHVNWFNLNTFDYHTPKNIPKTVGSHSDLKMIDAVVYKLLMETIPTKFVLGMAAFGRTYTLADDRCTELNCPFRSPGLGGCGNTPGFLPFAEISEYIDSNSYDELHHDISSSSMVAVVDSDQMISFDNEETWAIKEAYAEMMCLRGTMLWSIDMLKAPSTPARSQTRERALLEREVKNSCSLCGGFKLFTGATIEYDGDTVPCAMIDDMLTANFVPPGSDQCTDITSMYQDSCCAKAPSTPCNICGSETIFEDRLIRYAGVETTCRDISESFLQFTDEHSFSCSLAKSLIPRTCCADSPAVDKIQEEVEAFIAAADDEPIPCNICQQGSLHHALKAETMVEYKGASISCLDVNSILAKNENIGSEMCDATQSLLFKGCCYEKCSLCSGEESLNVDATVKYNGKVLSCDVMSSMFSLGVTEKGSEQCDAMQTAYASTCCYKPPEKPCNLCTRGSTSYEVNTRAFVKTHSSSSSFCVDVLNRLAAREEEGSETCMHSKTAFFSKCCDILSVSTQPKQNKPHDWLTEYVSPPQSSGFLPSSIWALIFASLVGVVLLC